MFLVNLSSLGTDENTDMPTELQVGDTRTERNFLRMPEPTAMWFIVGGTLAYLVGWKPAGAISIAYGAVNWWMTQRA